MFIFETAKGFNVNLFLAQNFFCLFLAQSGFLFLAQSLCFVLAQRRRERRVCAEVSFLSKENRSERVIL